MITVRFFAQLAEQAQCDSLDMEYSVGLDSRTLVSRISGKVPKAVIDTLHHDVVMLSVNQQIAGWDDPLQDGDEVAFLPPFSGG